MKSYKEVSEAQLSGEVLSKVKKWADKSDGFSSDGMIDQFNEVSLKRTGKRVVLSGKDLKSLGSLNPKEIYFTDKFFTLVF